MDKKPLFDSDIDPKRIKNVADGLRRQGEFESARMLDGYADLLEAQEKAVPVAWCRFIVADESGPEGFDPGDIIDLDIHPHAERPEGNGWQAMVLDATHPAPSDAERFAEALRNLIGDCVGLRKQGEFMLTSPELEAAKQALAAHSAQAQPPAASATPNLASYWRIVAEAAEVLQMVLDSGVKLPPNWRGPLLDELSGLSAMMLTAQENPNG